MPRLQNRSHNRKAATSLANRQRGIFKKSHTLKRMYGGEVAVFIKQQDGYILRYESRPGILSDASLMFPNESFGPDDFDTITDRRSTPELSTTIPTMQFFGIGDNTEPSSINDINRTTLGSPLASLDDVTVASTSSSNPDSQDLYPTALGPSTSSPLGFCDQEQYIDDNSTPAAFYVPKGYIFPSSLLPNLPRRENTYRSTSSSSPSPSSSSPLPTTSQSLFLPSDIDSSEHDSVSVISSQPTSPNSQDDLLSLIDEYARE
ncbi:hypothetical protein HD806DRAFT_536084 [Xylariaceae sp. AK1471]|nr:hypothetical protein HD806DRAFT_536084 [Xylariaceae sp. AK1471]